ncbi:MAG: hypothetical protein K6A23_00715, partial [Butyrivibrio sp.]|nr:hypothetical protein [Butyrivibrio sp.]
MKIKVVIPSAKLIESELRYIGNIPPIIYPFNQKMVLDYLTDIYKTDKYQLTVVSYGAKDLVRKKLN